MKDYLKRPEFMREAKEMSKGRNLFVEILLFVAVAFATTFAVSILTVLAIVAFMTVKIYAPSLLHLNVAPPTKVQLIQSISDGSDSSTIIMLFSEIAMIGVVFLFCRWIEKRKLRTLGFLKKRVVIEYVKGLCVGLVIFSVAVLLCVATGTLKITGFSIGFSALTVVLYFFGYMIQGMAEEVLCRGYFMVSLARRCSIPVAVFVSSSAFSLLHLGNPGITALAVVNLTLFGIFAGVVMIKEGNIWMVAGIHSMWNFTQGNVFGIQVSGLEQQNSIFSSIMSDEKQWISGGSFGLEGGAAVSIVLVIGILCAVLLAKKGEPEIPNTDEVKLETESQDFQEDETFVFPED